MDKIIAVVNALKAGEQLENSATWKNRTMLINVFLVLITTIVQFVPQLNLTDADAQSIASGAAILAGTINTYMHAATSKTVGIGTAAQPTATEE